MEHNIKEIVHGKDLGGHVISGIEKIYIPVAMTLGSHGKFVALEMKNGKFRFTKDGVSIAKEIEVENKFEQIYVQAIFDASMATLNMIGDGTTSTIILAYHMIKNMIKDMDDDKALDTKKYLDGIDEAMKRIESEHALLKGTSITSLEDLISVATTSSNGDREFGKLVGEIYNRIGGEGFINIHYHDDQKITVDYADGYIVDEGLIAYEFINHNGACALENPHVYVTNRPIEDADEFVKKILTPVHDSNVLTGVTRPLFIVAGDFSREVLATMGKNMGAMPCCPIKAPSTGDMKNNYLEDIAHVTGSTFVNGEKDMHIEDYSDLTHYGTAKKVEVKVGETIITTDGRSQEDYIKGLEDMLLDSSNDILKEFINMRIAKIRGSIATLNLKKSTTTEMSLNYDRYDDSIKATRNAVKNGVLSGGGRVYNYISNKLDSGNSTDSSDFAKGISSMSNALLSITRVNLENSRHADDKIDSIIMSLYHNDDVDIMYDTVSRSLGSGRAFGVLESYASSIICIRNAYSVAKTIINTGSAVVKAPKLDFM